MFSWPQIVKKETQFEDFKVVTFVADNKVTCKVYDNVGNLQESYTQVIKKFASKKDVDKFEKQCLKDYFKPAVDTSKLTKRQKLDLLDQLYDEVGQEAMKQAAQAVVEREE